MSQTYLINFATFTGFEDLSVNINPSRMAVFIKKAQDLDLRPFMGASFYTDFIQYFASTGLSLAVISTPNTTAVNGTYPNQPLTNIVGTGINATATFTVFNGAVTAIVPNAIGSGYNVNDTFTCAAIPGALFSVTMTGLIILPACPQIYKDLFNGLTYTDKAGHAVGYDGMIPALVYWSFARFIEADSFQYTRTGPVMKLHEAAVPVDPKDIAKLVQQQRSVANAHANDIELFLYNNKANYPLWRFNECNKASRQSGPRIRGIDKTDYNMPGYGGNTRLPGYFGYDNIY